MRHAGRNKALVASWIDFLSPPLRELAESVRRQVRQAGPELAESIQWGKLVFSVDSLPVLALVPARGHLNLQMLQGAHWPAAVLAERPALGGARQWRLDPAAAVDPVLLEMVVSAALVQARERLDRSPPRRDEP
ncbi:DUF1801 domain-containing protein [Ideonella sp. 4Y11]|uniref:DUF1801 domain-containing protein n=1 Tax=Ideonella aquatica TaxID=2824119 RepID=A0A941BIB6_9BURK|nr:DUF1801 domain-containing protein [Ideonella aquatica]MBQ0957673.1 DUF1801 domain-containing protein [Ideonella aquatica]